MYLAILYVASKYKGTLVTHLSACLETGEHVPPPLKMLSIIYTLSLVGHPNYCGENYDVTTELRVHGILILN